MPNKFITNLDLARQAEIFSGETAVFKGGMQLGIPFSGFPTGVDTSTISSLGVVDTQFAVFSGNTGTTVFNVTDPTSPYYSAITGTIVYSSPYMVIDNNSITELVPITTYPTLMSFTAATGVNAEPISAVFASPVVQEIYDSGLYGTLFNNLGSSSTGVTFVDETFYNRGSIFSGASLNMEINQYGSHGSTPSWVTGTTSGTVIEYSALTQYWTDPTIISYTSGLTLPITPESADTQTSDYIWTLTDSTVIDENLVGIKYTGYSITYSFNDVVIDPSSPSITGGTSADTYYYGSVVATFENFSAGTLDYKGSTNWLTIDGRATVEERFTTDRMTILNPDTGSSVSTLGITVDGKVVTYTPTITSEVTGLTFDNVSYDLSLGLDNGTSFTDNLGILASDIKVTGGTYDNATGEMTFVNNSGGSFVISGLTTGSTLQEVLDNGSTATISTTSRITAAAGSLSSNIRVEPGQTDIYSSGSSGSNWASMGVYQTGSASIIAHFSGTQKSLAFNSGDITLTDGSSKGIQYAADYSSTYSNRSLVDKEYVDGTSGIGTISPNTIPTMNTGGTAYIDSALISDGTTVALNTSLWSGALFQAHTTGTEVYVLNISRSTAAATSERTTMLVDAGSGGATADNIALRASSTIGAAGSNAVSIQGVARSIISPSTAGITDASIGVFGVGGNGSANSSNEAIGGAFVASVSDGGLPIGVYSTTYGTPATAEVKLFYGTTSVSNSADNIGMKINISNPGAGNAYALQLVDGTETVSGGGFLKDTGSGKANWVDITSADLPTNIALVGTYTNNYVPRWNATTNTLASGSIRDNGTDIGIGTGTNSNTKVSILGTTSNTAAVKVDMPKPNTTGDKSAIYSQFAVGGPTQAFYNSIYSRVYFTDNPTNGTYSAGRFILGTESTASTETIATALLGTVRTQRNTDSIYGMYFDVLEVQSGDIIANNAYGLYLPGWTVNGTVTGTKYGIYQQGTGDKNYFGGQLQLNTIGSGTPVTNLGVDASGNVVSGTTGGGGSVWTASTNTATYDGNGTTETAIKLVNSTSGAGVNDGLVISLQSSNVDFINKESGDIDFRTRVGSTDIDRLRILNDGTVNVVRNSGGLVIGNGTTTTPASIGVYGTAGNAHFSSGTYGYTTNDGMFVGIGTGADAHGYAWVKENLPFIIKTNNTEKLRVKGDGNVGIGFPDFNDGTAITAKLHVRGSGTTSSGSSFIVESNDGTDSFEIKDDGTIVISNVGSTTPVTNLAVDASGNVVSGTTGGGGGLNYISAGAVATNLETTSNWDINGVYTGATATGSQGDCHFDSAYWFTCVATDTWIRLIRG